jgi:hypothetical protein
MLTTASSTGISGSAISSGTVVEAYGGTGTSTGYYGFKNRIINGAMVIDQRNAGASLAITTTGQYSVDRFQGGVYGSGTGRFSLQQSSTVPDGFTNSLLATVTTADASPSASYGYAITQPIEGYNIADLGWGTANAQPATLSFWVRSSVTGTFPVVFQNNAADKAYGGQYTISSANTWEQKSIVVSGVTSGTWLTTNGAGIYVNFGLGGGSNRTMSSGLQTIGGALTTMNVTGSTQLIATNGATFYITGVQLEKGSTATSFDYRDYGRELIMCQRYYYLHGSGADQSIGDGSMYASNILMMNVNFPVSMRTAPTLVQTTGTNYYRFWRNSASDDFNDFSDYFSASTRCAAIQTQNNISGTAGQAGRTVTLSASASIAFNSEL